MQICVPIREKDPKIVLEMAQKARKNGADMIELWLDQIEIDKRREVDQVKKLIEKLPKPLIVACKRRAEGGSFTGADRRRIELLEKAAAAGADYIDIDLKTARRHKKRLQKNKKKLIVSYHDFQVTPSLVALEKIVGLAKKAGAEIVKIATFAARFEDNVVLFELTKRARSRGEKIIAVGMGEKGRISRIGCPLLGSMVSFAALDSASKTAEGQLTLDELNDFI